MSCIKCEDLSTPETHPVKDFVRSLRCKQCNKERIKRIGILGFVILIFVTPIILYSLIRWDPVISGSEDETTTLGYWIVIILWFSLLGMFFYYRGKVERLKEELYETVYVVKRIEKNLNIVKQINLKMNNRISTGKERLFNKAEKNRSWDNLANHDDDWGVNIEEERWLLEKIENIVSKKYE